MSVYGKEFISEEGSMKIQRHQAAQAFLAKGHRFSDH